MRGSNSLAVCVSVLAIGLVAGCSRAGDDAARSAAEDLAADTMPTTQNAGFIWPAGPALWDCISANGALVAAHRGGPAPGYPENAIETFAHALANATPLLEVDVSESRDGVQFLFHDRSLPRLTGVEGQVVDTDWADIADLKLIDNDGNVTPYTAPLLSDALKWAVENGAMLELDRKQAANPRKMIEAVRAARAEDHVILITYSVNDAALYARIAPGIMMTASINSLDDLAALEAAGVPAETIIAWTGTRNPDPALWAALEERGIETAFGTLGRPAERLDTQWVADGNLEEYQGLVDNTLDLIATDEPYRVAAALSADDAALKACAR
jgi:glycerophosphoryl diester phosphodiesterase